MLSHRRLKAALDKKPGAEASYPFGPGTLVHKVGGKVFALLAQTEGQVRITLKCAPHLGEAMRHTYAAVTPGYHTNKRHWISIVQDEAMPDGEVLKLIDHSYDLVRAALPKKTRIGLGLEP
jgi:predicted DNA-binding protein (MmcQ/YjbR family)